MTAYTLHCFRKDTPVRWTLLAPFLLLLLAACSPDLAPTNDVLMQPQASSFVSMHVIPLDSEAGGGQQSQPAITPSNCTPLPAFTMNLATLIMMRCTDSNNSWVQWHLQVNPGVVLVGGDQDGELNGPANFTWDFLKGSADYATNLAITYNSQGNPQFQATTMEGAA